MPRATDTIRLLASRGILSPRHISAAGRLAHDIEKAAKPTDARVLVTDRIDGRKDATDRRMVERYAALERVNAALSKCSEVSRLILLDVLRDGRSLEQVRKMRGFPQHYAGPRLREALDELAQHYQSCR